MKTILTITLLQLLCLNVYSDGYVWRSKAALPASARHRAAALSIGNKGYVGFGRVHSGAIWINYNDWWEYDPATNSWTQKADCPMGFNTGATFSINGKGYIGTGDGEIISSAYKFGESSYFFEYDPLLNNWTQKANFPYIHCEGVGFAINGKGYIGAGRNYSGTNCPLCEYDPVTDVWNILAYTSVINSSRIPSKFVLNNKAYILESPVDPYDNSKISIFWEFDPTAMTITQKASCIGPPMLAAAGFGVRGKGYLGASASTDFYVYDPLTDTWDTLSPHFPGVRRGYAPSFIIGDNAYFATGSNGTNLKDLWAYEWKVDVGIEEQQKHNSLQIYPNPAIEFINVSIKENNIHSSFSIKLFQLDGKEILAQKLEKEITKINIAEISSGTYMCVLLNETNQTLSTKKIIIN